VDEHRAAAIDPIDRPTQFGEAFMRQEQLTQATQNRNEAFPDLADRTHDRSRRRQRFRRIISLYSGCNEFACFKPISYFLFPTGTLVFELCITGRVWNPRLSSPVCVFSLPRDRLVGRRVSAYWLGRFGFGFDYSLSDFLRVFGARASAEVRALSLCLASSALTQDRRKRVAIAFGLARSESHAFST
jgi:hypothetical protein